jgi:hypothetical protein
MEIDKIKEKILNYCRELKQLALEAVYFKLNN